MGQNGNSPMGPAPSHWLNLLLTSPHLHQLNIFLFLSPHHPCSNGTAGGFKSTAGDLCPGIGRHRPTGACRNTTMPPCPAACLKPARLTVRRKSVLADCLPSYYDGRAPASKDKYTTSLVEVLVLCVRGSPASSLRRSRPYILQYLLQSSHRYAAELWLACAPTNDLLVRFTASLPASSALVAGSLFLDSLSLLLRLRNVSSFQPMAMQLLPFQRSLVPVPSISSRPAAEPFRTYIP